MTFEAKLREFLPRLRSLSVGIARDPSAAEDLLSVTLLKACERWDRFDGKNFMGWMTAMMRNTWIDSRRHERVKRRRLGREVDLDTLAAPAPDWWRKLDTDRVIDAACARLKISDHHKTFLSDYAGGHTSQQIASMRGTTDKNVRSAMCRMRKKFQSLGALDNGEKLL